MKAETRLLKTLVQEVQLLRADLQTVQQSIGLDDLLSMEAFSIRYADKVRSLAALRFQKHEQHKNGLADHGAFVKRGKSVFVVVPRYLDWLLGRPPVGTSDLMSAGGSVSTRAAADIAPGITPATPESLNKEADTPTRNVPASSIAINPEAHHCGES